MTESELDLETWGVKPEEAKSKLEDMGYTEDTWDKIMKKGFGIGGLGSHETRALITIARGSETRFLGEVYQEMRVQSGLPADRLAERRKRKQ